MRNGVVSLALVAAIACGAGALPVGYPEVSRAEADKVRGGDSSSTCYYQGASISICSGLFCGIFNKGKNSGNKPETSGSGTKYGKGTIRCQCDASSSLDDTAGTCSN